MPTKSVNEDSFGKRYFADRRKLGLLSFGFILRSRIVLQHLRPRTSVLDIGAADGAMLAYLSTKMPLELAVSLERNPDLARHIKTNGVCGSALDLPFSGPLFDFVICSATRKHIKDSPRMASEAFRVLVPGGRLIVVDPHPHLLRLGQALGKFDPRYLHHLSLAREIATEMTLAGFKIESQVDGIFVSCVALKP